MGWMMTRTKTTTAMNELMVYLDTCSILTAEVD